MSTEPGRWTPGEAGVAQHGLSLASTATTLLQRSRGGDTRRLLERQVVALGLLGASTEPRVVTPRRPPSQARVAASGGELQRSRGVTTQETGAARGPCPRGSF